MCYLSDRNITAVCFHPSYRWSRHTLPVFFCKVIAVTQDVMESLCCTKWDLIFLWHDKVFGTANGFTMGRNHCPPPRSIYFLILWLILGMVYQKRSAGGGPHDSHWHVICVSVTVLKWAWMRTQLSLQKGTGEKQHLWFVVDGKAERIGIPAKNYGHVHKWVGMFPIV